MILPKATYSNSYIHIRWQPVHQEQFRVQYFAQGNRQRPFQQQNAGFTPELQPPIIITSWLVLGIDTDYWLLIKILLLINKKYCS